MNVITVKGHYSAPDNPNIVFSASMPQTLDEFCLGSDPDEAIRSSNVFSFFS